MRQPSASSSRNAEVQSLPKFLAKLSTPTGAALKSLEELSGPMYQNFLASSMTDDELGDLLEKIKHEIRAERRWNKQP